MNTRLDRTRPAPVTTVPGAAAPAVAAAPTVAERRVLLPHPHSVLTVYVTSLAQGAMGVMLPASSAVLRGRLDLGDTLYGALFLPGLGLAVVTSLLGHWLLRRWSLRSLFLFALASQVLTMVLMAIGGSLARPVGLPLLFAGLAVSGPAGGLIGITLNTAAMELFPRSRSGALSVLHGILGAGATVGPMLVAGMAGLGFWAGAPLVMAAVMAALVLAAAFRPVRGLRETVPPEHTGPLPRSIWAQSSTALVYGIAEATFTAWAVLYLKEKGLPLGIAAGALSAFWLAMAGGRILAGVAVRWISPVRLAFVLSAGLLAAFPLVAGCRGEADSLARFAFAGISCSALFPLLLGITSAGFPDRTPQISAVFTATALSGLAIGSFSAGALRSVISLTRMYQLSAAWPLVLIVLLALLHGRAPARALPGTPRCRSSER
jgi:MFS family permease